MMAILVKIDDVRREKKAEARHGRLRVAQESLALETLSPLEFLIDLLEVG